MVTQESLGPRPPSHEDRSDQSLGLLVRQLHLALRAAANAALSGEERGLPHLGILAAIEQTPGITSAELARQHSVRPASIAEVIADLEASRLIVRRQDPAGGRALGARLTSAGAAALRAGQDRLGEVEANMLHGLSGTEREVLRDLLKRCIASLQASEAKGLPRPPVRDHAAHELPGRPGRGPAGTLWPA